MPAPRVFVSSTCYDLKYIRENLKFFIKELGYEPVLSEEGAVFYDPNLDVQDSCLTEVPACQMFVLIIGGRFGGRYKNTEKSITNAEYQEAVKAKVPIFALIERNVYDEYRVYLSNKDNKAIDAKKISYPGADSTKIFDFIEEVQKQSINNALVPFSDFEVMQDYLKQQWASMMYRFLTTEGEAKRVGSMLTALTSVTEKIEFLSRQVVDSVGDKKTKITVELYDHLLGSSVATELTSWGLRPTPEAILKHESFEELISEQFYLKDEGDSFLLKDKDKGDYAGIIDGDDFKRIEVFYLKLRERLIAFLKKRGMTPNEYLKQS